MKFRSFLTTVATFSALAANPAFALSPQVFVSGKGADRAGCGTTTAPCRSFQYAHDAAVTAGGMIAVMDSGDYGPVKITKSVSIINNGAGVAAISAASARTAIEIDIPSSGRVVLRGLTVDGGKTQDWGLRVPNAATLEISKCVFRNFNQSGIALAGFTPLSFIIADTESSDNLRYGLEATGPVSIDGVIRNSRFNRNGTGISAGPSYRSIDPGVRLVVKGVEVNGANTGFAMWGYDPTRDVSTLAGVSISNTSTALLASLSGALRVSRSTFVNNNEVGGFGLVTSSGDNQASLYSVGPTMTVVPMK